MCNARWVDIIDTPGFGFCLNLVVGRHSGSCSSEHVFVLQVSSPTIIVERAGSYAWTHKSWRVREEFARTVTSAIGLFAATELPLQRAILPPVYLLTFMGNDTFYFLIFFLGINAIYFFLP